MNLPVLQTGVRILAAIFSACGRKRSPAGNFAGPHERFKGAGGVGVRSCARYGKVFQKV